MDRTADLYSALERAAPFRGGSFSRLACTEQARKVRSRILSSPFHRQALQISRAVLDVAIAAKGSGDGEGGKVHAELSSCIKDFQAKLAVLQSETTAGKPGDPKKHKAGVLLILSEQLQTLADIQKELLAERLTPDNVLWSARGAPPASTTQSGGRGGVDWASEGGSRNARGDGEGSAMQLALQEENQDLLAELMQTSRTMDHVERTLMDIASLNSVFSTQIREQAEQLEALYEEALDTTSHFDRGNVELEKTLRRNKAGSRYILTIVIIATLLLLFLDWYT